MCVIELLGLSLYIVHMAIIMLSLSLDDTDIVSFLLFLAAPLLCGKLELKKKKGSLGD